MGNEMGNDGRDRHTASTETTGITCEQCGHALDDDRGQTQKEPCPECGSDTRVYAVAGTAHAKTTASVMLEHVRETVKRHGGWLVVAVALGLLGAAVGYFLGGTLLGAAIGIAISLIGLPVRGKVTTRERPVTRSGRS